MEFCSCCHVFGLCEQRSNLCNSNGQPKSLLFSPCWLQPTSHNSPTKPHTHTVNTDDYKSMLIHSSGKRPHYWLTLTHSYTECLLATCFSRLAWWHTSFFRSVCGRVLVCVWLMMGHILLCSETLHWFKLLNQQEAVCVCVRTVNLSQRNTAGHQKIQGICLLTKLRYTSNASKTAK